MFGHGRGTPFAIWAAETVTIEDLKNVNLANKVHYYSKCYEPKDGLCILLIVFTFHKT